MVKPIVTETVQNTKKISSKLLISLKEIFKFRLRKTYKEMLETGMISKKLSIGSPRTVKIFERFVLKMHDDEAAKPRKKEKRSLF
jgi:hypothetical protein